ncbi:MAG: hypothetical protein ABIR47_04265 [Candidatus Kapaibacterium sp.]
MALVLAVAGLSPVARGQELFRASWTIQDKTRGLQQDIAREIIQQFNNWQTRDDPYATTVRIDDFLRVTVVGELLPSNAVRNHLTRLVLGTLVIEKHFDEFLDTATISSLERRDHYWCDEAVLVYDPVHSPISTTGEEGEIDSSLAPYLRSYAGRRLPRARLALDESSLRIGTEARIWAGIGFEEIALPDFTYGSARLGVSYGGLRLWGTLPAPIGTRSNPLLARGLEGSYGFGVAFDEDHFGGMVSSAFTPKEISSVPGTDRYFIGHMALLYGIIPIRLTLLNDVPLRVKLGLGYLDARKLPLAPDGAGVATSDEQSGLLAPMAHLEYARIAEDGTTESSATVGFFSDNLYGSYQGRFSTAFGWRVTAAAYGLLGSRAAYLPSFAITPSITYTFW